MNGHFRIRKHLIMQIILFILLTAIDQISKICMSDLLHHNGDITLIPGVLKLHYLENTGAAFGIFQGRQWIFYILTAVILGIIVYLFIRLYRAIFRYSGSDAGTVSRILCFGYGLTVLCSGAVGNLIDRIAYGYVIDFICVLFIDFPVFNFADICVTISAIFLVIYFIFVYKKDDNIRIL